MMKLLQRNLISICLGCLLVGGGYETGDVRNTYRLHDVSQCSSAMSREVHEVVTLDVDFDALSEELVFYELDDDSEEEQYVTGVIATSQGRRIEFPIGEPVGFYKAVVDKQAWKLPDEQAHIVAIKTCEDHRTAFASCSCAIHFFHLNAVANITSLGMIAGGELHAARSGPRSQNVSIEFVNTPLSVYFRVHDARYCHEQVVNTDGEFLGYRETSQRETYKLVYDAQTKTLVQRDLHVETSEKK